VHVHPTRACNLACAHCYSTSSPAERASLGADVLVASLGHLKAEGYEIVSVSGGEPLVYRELDRLTAGAAQLGYRVHMITNGVLLSARRLETLREHVHLIGVSVDGTEEIHNAVRGRDDAYRNAMRALEVLAASDLPFGIVYGVSARSLGDVPWAYELAARLGASLLHLRPLAPEGRARTMASEWTLTSEDCERLMVLGELLRALDPEGPRVQLDLEPTDAVCAARDQFELLAATPNVTCLSDAVNPLVIDEEGRCLPFAYGMDPSFELASLPAETFRGAFDRLPRVATLLQRAFQEAAADDAPAYLDWFAHLTRVSRKEKAALEWLPPALTPHRSSTGIERGDADAGGSPSVAAASP
jgi:Fe-coproporphyrin III synthase